MNIKINKEEAEWLFKLEYSRYIFGSYLYGTQKENSDQDILVIYNLPQDWECEHLLDRIHHQFQWDDVENNIQYVFTYQNQYWNNLESGDSTINADILIFENTNYKSQWKHVHYKETLNYCKTYNIIKAYLGFAKRDLKQYTKKNKLFHAIRGLSTAYALMENRLITKQELIDIKDLITTDSSIFDINILINLEKELRKKLNDMYQKRKIKRYYIEESGDELLDKLLNSLNIDEFKY